MKPPIDRRVHCQRLSYVKIFIEMIVIDVCNRLDHICYRYRYRHRATL